MQTPNPYPALFSPFQLGTRTLKNRIVHLAMNTHMAERTRVTETPREYIAQRTALVTRQGIIRRFHEKRIEVIPLAQPRWSEWREGRLEYANVYGGATNVIADVALLAYATPRIPVDALVAPLRARGVEVRLAGDCALPQGLLAATRGGHAAGMAV